ncbi:MAG: hypothetical protein EBX02_10625 [Betaproteobacteria bacterium]|nr:hypothetical protein [Betaproteobacteria bacterium]
MTLRGTLERSLLLPYIVVQLTGAVLGACLAHLMFDLDVIQFSTKERSGVGIWTGELVATATAAAPGTIQMGYVKTKAVQTLTLFEASANTVADNAANVYGTANAWLSSAPCCCWPTIS